MVPASLLIYFQVLGATQVLYLSIVEDSCIVRAC
jgi:hypothetical protein